MTLSYRITKYNPDYRDSRGSYFRDEWTAISDINMIFDGGQLTAAEYLRVEALYVQAVIEFMIELEIPHLQVQVLTKWNKKLQVTKHQGLYTDQMKELYLKINEGDLVESSEIVELIRLVLRDELGCKLKYQNEFEVHFGYDYYMYVIMSQECIHVIEKIKQSGLYVELYESPYIEG